MKTIDLLDAPLTDAFARRIDYLRISVTDKCNLRCIYCMPAEGLTWIEREQLLSFEEIERLVRVFASVGVRKLRISGGEPLVRRDLPRLVGMLAAVEGIEEIALSTNGILLEEQLPALMDAGLTRVNISLDTLRDDRFEALARRPGLASVLAAIDASVRAGARPVKLNCVAMRGRNDDEIEAFARYARDREVAVRFIELMPVRDNLGIAADAFIGADEILERISAIASLVPVEGPRGNGPARYFGFADGVGTIGVISPLSHDYCERCNRVRLTADGRLRLCLFGENHLDLKRALRDGESDERLRERLTAAMLVKPERHHLRVGEPASQMRAFSEIGG
ncbi:MAG: GTP 3',8-cyclase MoaA [Candidatus Eremiobacteraeota bacterium]|nr:GTP 3',8-cyclase MoaA [Candidatus Eremiobacteraeota bacterium]